MACKYCGSANVKEIRFDVYNSGFFCNDCAAGEVIYLPCKCCDKENFINVAFEQSNGTWVERIACTNCKKLKSGNQKRSAVFNSLRKYYQEKYLKDCEERNESYKRVLDCINDLKAAHKDLNDRVWWIKYEAYLKSPEWAAKRKLVLERENYICQGCMKNRAIQAHHTTYENVFDELLFQLIALCIECHAKLHPDKFTL